MTARGEACEIASARKADQFAASDAKEHPCDNEDRRPYKKGEGHREPGFAGSRMFPVAVNLPLLADEAADAPDRGNDEIVQMNLKGC